MDVVTIWYNFLYVILQKKKKTYCLVSKQPFLSFKKMPCNIVEFPKNKTGDIVACLWTIGEKTLFYWPPLKSFSKQIGAVKELEPKNEIGLPMK